MAKKRVEILDADLIERVQRQADNDKRSFTSQVAVMLEEALIKREAKGRG